MPLILFWVRSWLPQKTSEIPGCGCLSLTWFRDGWAACHVKVGFESSVRSCVLLLQLEMIQFHGHSCRAECAESPPQFGAISSRQTCRSAALPADKKKQAARNAFAHLPQTPPLESEKEIQSGKSTRPAKWVTPAGGMPKEVGAWLVECMTGGWTIQRPCRPQLLHNPLGLDFGVANDHRADAGRTADLSPVAEQVKRASCKSPSPTSELHAECVVHSLLK